MRDYVSLSVEGLRGSPYRRDELVEACSTSPVSGATRPRGRGAFLYPMSGSLRSSHCKSPPPPRRFWWAEGHPFGLCFIPVAETVRCGRPPSGRRYCLLASRQLRLSGGASRGRVVFFSQGGLETLRKIRASHALSLLTSSVPRALLGSVVPLLSARPPCKAKAPRGSTLFCRRVTRTP